MIISKDSEKKGKACSMLINKALEIGRVPIKAAFNDEELVFIKAHLGPWPRALEASGLKTKIKHTGRPPKTIIKKKPEKTNN